jgi:hypothetical protein
VIIDPPQYNGGLRRRIVLSSPVPFHLGVSMWYRHVELKRKIASAFNTHFRDLSETDEVTTV